MFEYSCSDNKLVSWIFQQVNSDYNSLFPQAKGWELFLHLYYSGTSKYPFFLVTVSDAEECIIFLPLDESTNTKATVKETKILDYVSNSLGFKDKKYQLILLSSEKYRTKIEQWFNYSPERYPILILSSHSAQFLRGSFNNPKLEFRLLKLIFEVDLIPDFIPPGFWHYNEGAAKASIFQHFLHHLYGYWIRGEKKIIIRNLLSEIIIYWNSYSKIDRQKIITFFNDEIKNMSKLFFQDIFEIHTGRDSSNSGNDSSIKFNLEPNGKKDLFLWIKKQDKAVSWFRVNTEQISVDKIE